MKVVNVGEFAKEKGCLGAWDEEYQSHELEEDALLVTGTLGFTVEEEGEGGVPVVEPHQVWSLLLPQGSHMRIYPPMNLLRFSFYLIFCLTLAPL